MQEDVDVKSKDFVIIFSNQATSTNIQQEPSTNNLSNGMWWDDQTYNQLDRSSYSNDDCNIVSRIVDKFSCPTGVVGFNDDKLDSNEDLQDNFCKLMMNFCKIMMVNN